MPYHVYILKCADNTLYAGCTNNLEKRIAEHNESKKGARYTKARRPVTLVHHETFETLKKARQRECEIKIWTRNQKLELIKNFKNKLA